MTESMHSSSDAYHHLYKGKTFLLKVSGNEIDSKHFPDLIRDVRDLTRCGLKFIIICGSGRQNSQHLQEYLANSGEEWVEPLRVDGRRVTDWKQMQHGVLPAHTAIRSMLHCLLPEATILRPEHIQCSRLHKLGFVGNPEQISGLDSGDIVVALSVGSDGRRELNVNADDTARVVTQQEHSRLNEVIFATNTGGVLNGGRVVPLLWEEDIAMDGTHSRIDVSGGGGGMQKKLREAKEMLRWVEKIVITGVQSVRKEIEDVLGSGTMIVSKNALQFVKLQTDDDAHIFDFLYRKHVADGDFRDRTPEELRELRNYVYLLKASNSILGAFALIPRGYLLEMATVCSEYKGSGVGNMLVQAAQREARRQNMDGIYAFASSHASRSLFVCNEFELLGNVSELKKEYSTHYECLPGVMRYDTSKRDPSLCIWKKEIADARKF